MDNATPMSTEHLYAMSKTLGCSFEDADLNAMQAGVSLIAFTLQAARDNESCLS